jgi:hypothetical protein
MSNKLRVSCGNFSHLDFLTSGSNLTMRAKTHSHVEHISRKQAYMATKTGTWLMAVGVFIVFAGLCFLPAAFGRDADKTMLGAGAMVIAIGAALIAAGFYVKARALGTTTTATPSSAKRIRGKSTCDQCGLEEPVIQCRVHQIHLCAACLGGHYDFRSCAYVPSTRRGALIKSNSAAYSQTASS